MIPSAHRAVSKLQRGRARSLRRGMTDAERKLWRALRGHRFQRLSFRRQAPIGPFIVDFVCHEHCLVIEIDGGQHAEKVLHDAERDAWLVSKGYRILRFWNSDVLQNMQGVREAVLNAVASNIPPSLTLPLKGGGDEAVAEPRTAAPNSPPKRAREQASTHGEAKA